MKRLLLLSLFCLMAVTTPAHAKERYVVVVSSPSMRGEPHECWATFQWAYNFHKAEMIEWYFSNGFEIPSEEDLNVGCSAFANVHYDHCRWEGACHHGEVGWDTRPPPLGPSL